MMRGLLEPEEGEEAVQQELHLRNLGRGPELEEGVGVAEGLVVHKTVADGGGVGQVRELSEHSFGPVGNRSVLEQEPLAFGGCKFVEELVQSRFVVEEHSSAVERGPAESMTAGYRTVVGCMMVEHKTGIAD